VCRPPQPDASAACRKQSDRKPSRIERGDGGMFVCRMRLSSASERLVWTEPPTVALRWFVYGERHPWSARRTSNAIERGVVLAAEDDKEGPFGCAGLSLKESSARLGRGSWREILTVIVRPSFSFTLHLCHHRGRRQPGIEIHGPVVVAAIGGHEGLIVDLRRDDLLEAFPVSMAVLSPL